MADVGAPPVIPADLQPYNSYETDPQYQRLFSTIWPSVLGFFILLSVPRVVQAIKRGRGVYSSRNWLGLNEDLSGKAYDVVPSLLPRSSTIQRKQGLMRKVENGVMCVGAVFYWTIPGIGLNFGHIVLLTGYATAVIVCIVKDAPLEENSNRAGFLAIAQLPVIFLFATKNSIVSLLLGPGNGYEKLNYIHRWSGRIMFLAAVIHGSLWIKDHLRFNVPILGEEKETTGITAFAILGLIVIFSLRPVRKFIYEVFWILHLTLFVAFFIMLCYHTPYAVPWIFPPLGFYGLDILLRMFRHRIKDAVLVPVGSQMTLIHVPYATSGWVAGQHVRLRVFFSGRVFESHPLTIFTAPPDISCITSMPQGVSFAARSVGDWTKALNRYATDAVVEIRELERKFNNGGAGSASAGLEMEKLNEKTPQTQVEVPIQVMMDGPYGGCSVDLGDYETALLFSGGSGITFTLGLLDDIVGRCVRQGRKNGERTRRIEFSWCIRSFGQIDWFAPALMDIATVAASSSGSSAPIDLHISIYVTCLCNPEAVPPIPNCDVTIVRPSVYRVLTDLITPPRNGTVSAAPPFIQSSPSSSNSKPKQYTDSGDVDPKTSLNSAESDIIVVDEEDRVAPSASSKLPWIEGGGVAVCASGPESLTREASNAVARVQMTGHGKRLGGMGLHTEVFSL